MTLKEAFKGWSGNCPKLAARYRSEFKHVFLSEHGKDDVRQFTEFYVRVLMEHNKSIPYVKTRAVACLLYVLKYAHEAGECMKPDFTAQQVLATTQETTEETNSSSVVREEISASPSVEQAVGYGQGDTAAKPAASPAAGPHRKGTRGGRRKVTPVSAIDPMTMKVVETYESLLAAAAAVHGNTGSICKGVKQKKMRYGFYWCRPGDENDFQPEERKTYTRRNNTQVLGRRKPVLEERDGLMHQTENDAPTTQTSLSDFSDVELRAELERRGWYGTLYQRLEFMAKHKTI